MVAKKKKQTRVPYADLSQTCESLKSESLILRERLSSSESARRRLVERMDTFTAQRTTMVVAMNSLAASLRATLAQLDNAGNVLNKAGL